MILGTLCYIRKGDATLLLHRNKKTNDSMEGYWIGLGGHVETDAGESPHECVTREVKEESGLTVVPVLRGIVTFAHTEPDVEDWYAYLFSATEYSGTLTDSREGELQWVSDDRLDRLNIPEGDRLFLEWLRQDARVFSAKFVYKGTVLDRHEVIFY